MARGDSIVRRNAVLEIHLDERQVRVPGSIDVLCDLGIVSARRSASPESYAGSGHVYAQFPLLELGAQADLPEEPPILEVEGSPLKTGGGLIGVRSNQFGLRREFGALVANGEKCANPKTEMGAERV